jgi:hypothetical protein
MHRRHLRHLSSHGIGRASAEVWWQLVDGNHRTAAEKDRPFDHIPQLADISGPRVHLEKLHGVLGKSFDLTPPIGRKLAQE